MENWRQFALPLTATLEEVIAILEKNQCAVVVDEHSRLLGTVTDRDLRKSLLRHQSLNSPVTACMNREPTTFLNSWDNKQTQEVHQKSGFDQYPIVDESGILCGLHTAAELLNTKLKNPIVLMAGGAGSRLAPLTNHCPKPLLKIGDRPVIETTLRELRQAGFERFWISVNYRSEMIKEHFGDGKRWDVQIKYLSEQEPLGTAGALSLLTEGFAEPVIVMNGDLLTKLNYHQLLRFHNYHQAQITVGVREYDLQVPYGVVDLEGVHIVKLEEKPVHKYFVNAGIYVIEPEMIEQIPNNFFNMTDLLSQSMPEGKVVAFPVHEYWVDIGQFEDFHKATADYDKVFLKGK